MKSEDIDRLQTTAEALRYERASLLDARRRASKVCSFIEDLTEGHVCKVCGRMYDHLVTCPVPSIQKHADLVHDTLKAATGELP